MFLYAAEGFYITWRLLARTATKERELKLVNGFPVRSVVYGDTYFPCKTLLQRFRGR